MRRTMTAPRGPVTFTVRETRLGVWRSFARPGGGSFSEYKSHARIFGLPFLHYTSGVNPETGRRDTAFGIIAFGRKAMGLVAIGQASAGLIAVGQACAGAFAFGQAAFGVMAIGQLGIGLYFGLGQIATGRTAIGQIAMGGNVLAQMGIGRHVWSSGGADPEAVAFFRALGRTILSMLGM